MQKIDVSKWKDFLVGDFFNAFLSSDDIQPKNITVGETPLVSSGKENNGIVAYIEDKKAKKWPGNTLSVDMFGKVFYQESTYHCVSHGRVNILIPKFEISPHALRFIATVIERVSSQKYEFSEMCTGKKLLMDIIKLPVDKTYNPDFLYMESYMKNLELAVNYSLNNLQSAKNSSACKQIDTTQWKEFIIKDLFAVKRPSARSQANYYDGAVPFIASGNFNNGVLKYLEPKKDEILDVGNCITVSPIDGSSFYQEHDFLGRGGAGSSIILLYNPNLNLYNGYFIATVIRTVCRKYAYSNMANKDTIGAEKIKLPVNSDGEPDYVYMEEYMKNILQKTQNTFSMMAECF